MELIERTETLMFAALLMSVIVIGMRYMLGALQQSFCQNDPPMGAR